MAIVRGDIVGAELITAYASGGPRDGVKLHAGHNWDGRVEIPYPHGSNEANSNKKRYHLGRYMLRRYFDKGAGVTYRVWKWYPNGSKLPSND